MNSSEETKGQAGAASAKANDNAGPKYYLNIEDKEYEWSKSTITVHEIRELGHIPADQPIILEDPEGTERTLAEDEIVDLKPGHRLGRAPKYKRG